MRGLITAALTLSIAASASADMAMIRFPLAPRKMDYVETDCVTRYRHEMIRVQADGKVLRLSLAGGLTTGRATRAEVQAIMATLDRSGLRDPGLLPPARLVPSDTDCFLGRVKRGVSEGLKLQKANGLGPQPPGLYGVLAAIDALGRRATQRVVIQLPTGGRP